MCHGCQRAYVADRHSHSSSPYVATQPPSAERNVGQEQQQAGGQPTQGRHEGAERVLGERGAMAR